MKKSEKKQKAIQNQIQNENAQKTMHDAQINLTKSTKSNVNLDDNKLQIKLTKKSAVGQLDNLVRGFYSNIKYLKKLADENNAIIVEWMKNTGIIIKRLFINEKNQNIIVSTKKYTAECDEILVDKFTVNDVVYCRIPLNKFTANQFITLFEVARKNEIKKQFDAIKAKKQFDKNLDKNTKSIISNYKI